MFSILYRLTSSRKASPDIPYPLLLDLSPHTLCLSFCNLLKESVLSTNKATGHREKHMFFEDTQISGPTWVH